MKNTMKWLETQEPEAQKLEGIVNHSQSLELIGSIVESLHQAWQYLTNFLAHSLIESGEFKVWQETDAAGNICWYAHDPITGESASRTSSADILDWIEQR